MSEKDVSSGYFGLGLQTWNLFELDQCRLCSCSYVCHYSYTHILLYYDLKELLAWFMTKYYSTDIWLEKNQHAF